MARLLTVIAILALGAVSTVQSATIQVSVSGIVDYLDPPGPGSPVLGDRMTIVYRYDDQTPDSEPDWDTAGSYDVGLQWLYVEANGQSRTFFPTQTGYWGRIRVGPVHDIRGPYVVSAFQAGEVEEEQTPVFAEIFFWNPAWPDPCDGFCTDELIRPGEDWSGWMRWGGEGIPPWGAKASIDSVIVTVVPLPSALILIASALATLTCLARRLNIRG